MNRLPVRGPALVVLGPGKVALQERSATAPSDGEVLIAPHFVGLCGTDLEIVKGELDPAYVRYPVVLGHEWSGRVLAVGARVPDLAPGDGVVVEGIRPCRLCPPCRSGRTNLCEDVEQLGFTLQGAASPAITTPWHLVHRIAPEVPLTAAALIEPGAVVLRGLGEIAIDPGANVLVVGDGTIALLAAHLVRLWSPGAVTMAGLRPAQAGLAKAMGVDHFTLDRPATGPYDVVIEAAGSTTAVADALRSAGRGGQVLLFGIAGHGRTAALPVDDVVNNDLRIRGSFSYTSAAWAQAVRLLNTGIYQPLPAITHRVRIEEYTRALRLLADPADGPRGKILIDQTPQLNEPANG
ncbi:alcohol dehydrogenase catalytic domain-containing protein [Streptomyces xanthochromogenes]|uniref:zinc-dependent alcohol dehydrogenase n=1 Tax=Streptomyces xanthochromogenes TaxID=67384 RepID=UPI003436E461